MEFHKTQLQVALDKHRFRVLCAGRRFGKSLLASEEIKGKSYGKSNRIAYIAPTYQQARDIMWNILKNELRPIATRINESRLEIEVKTKDGSTSLIILRGWESIDTLRGQSFDFIVIDEIAMMRNFWINWEEVIRPTLADRKGEVLFCSTPKGYNHFYDLYNMELKDQNFKSFHFTTYDNPFIPVEEIQEAKRQMSSDRFEQEFMAEFRKSEGLVYPEFDRQSHIVTECPKFKTIICGVDFGYTNPTGILAVGLDDDNNYWIFDESYKTQQTKEQTIAILKQFNPNYVYADPEDAEGIAKLKEAHFNVMEVNKSKIDGINSVRELLLQNRLKVLNKCINFIEEIEAYAYKENRDGKNTQEEPEKLNDHLMDSLKYIVFNHKINEHAFQDRIRVMQNRQIQRSFE